MQTYPNATVSVAKGPMIPVAPAAATAAFTELAKIANTCDCTALRTAVILFSGLNAGMLAIGAVWVLFRRSKWIKKGAEAKQAEYDKIKGEQKERKGLLARLADAL